jgi:hypothetical protein
MKNITKNLTKRQAKVLEEYLKDFNFTLDDYEIIFIPIPQISIRSEKAYRIIRDFMYSKYNVKI